MTRFNKVVPVLKVQDLQKTVDYYTQVLGFTLQGRSTDEDVGEICTLERDNVRLMFCTGTHLGEGMHLTGTLYIDVNGVQAFWEKVQQRVQVVWPLEAMDYGTLEFGIKDCNGYTLAFAEERQPA